MTAKQLIEIHGLSLIGQRVDTEAIGEYPGGIAIVTELAPDPEAPEIVFTVQHPSYGDIGVFDWEYVALVGTPVGSAGEQNQNQKTGGR